MFHRTRGKETPISPPPIASSTRNIHPDGSVRRNAASASAGVDVYEPKNDTGELGDLVFQLLAPRLSDAKQEEYEWYSAIGPLSR